MARRSNEVQAAARLLRPVDADTVRWRWLMDRKGSLIRHGATFTATGTTQWKLCHSTLGAVNQCDLTADGFLIFTGSRRDADSIIRWRKWPVNYQLKAA